MKFFSRRTFFWAGLAIFAIAFVTGLVYAYRQGTTSPMTVTKGFPGWKDHFRNIQIVLTSQLPREPAFQGKVFIALGDTPIRGDHITLRREAVGSYASSEMQLNLVNDEAFHTHTNATDMDFPTADQGHSRFPFDSSYVELNLSLQPSVPIDVVRVTNRVPGFILSASSVMVDRNADGSIRLRFLLKRNLFTQIFCGLILVAGLCFAVLILATQTAAALGSSVAAFFFSLWSLRGVLATQIQTFPTLFDYAIVLLCSFMLLGLIWRVLTHPELLAKESS